MFERNLEFNWQIEEFMLYCRTRQLREKTMGSYEQMLRLFERWCEERLFLRSFTYRLKAFFAEIHMIMFEKVAFCSRIEYMFAHVDNYALSTFFMCITVDNLDNFVDKQSIFP